MKRALLIVCTTLAVACTVGEPVVNAPPDTPAPNASVFADVVLAIADPSVIEACVEGVPLCGQMPEQTGPCADNAALGMQDDAPFEIPRNGRLDLGFLCSSIRETGGNTVSNDFRIWGKVVGDGRPVIEVSQDATHYYAVNLWPRTGTGFVENPFFQLEVPQWPIARFVRISEVGGQGTILVDAVEALPILVSP